MQSFYLSYGNWSLTNKKAWFVYTLSITLNKRKMISISFVFLQHPLLAAKVIRDWWQKDCHSTLGQFYLHRRVQKRKVCIMHFIFITSYHKNTNSVSFKVNNKRRASEEYKLQLRTKEMEINGRIYRFLWQLDTQIIFWEFALCCLCQVKITTVQGNIRCSRLKRGHSITPSYLCVKVFQKNQ